MYREDQSGASFVLGMMTGAFIGAGLALLFAPKTGHELRQQLGDQYRDLADRAGQTAQNIRESAQHLREQGRERISQLSDRLSSATASAERQPQGTTDRFPTSAPSV